MTLDNHAEFRDNLAAYALGALEAEETAALQAHLQSCDSCRSELVQYQRISAGLLTAVPPQSPSPAVMRRLAARLPSARRVKPIARSWGWSFGQGTALVALAILLIVNLLSLSQVRSLRLQQAELTRELELGQAALAMLAAPGAETLVVADGPVAGTLLIDRHTSFAMLVLWNLEQLQPQQTYQIWLIRPDGARVSAGLFEAAREGAVTLTSIRSGEALQAYAGIGITIEPAGGSQLPTGQRVFGVEF